MAETNFLNLQKVQPGEPLSINDYAFTTKNMDRIDMMLYRSLQHVHTGDVAGIDDPTSPLSLQLNATGGNIPAGVTARYVFTYVDEFGAETAPSPEIEVTTDSPVESPDAPGISRDTTGGVLLPGNYFYALSAYVGANTTETPTGPRAYTTVPVGTNTNSITLDLPTLPLGADGFNIYRRAPGEGVYSYLTSVDMTLATPPDSFLDDGSIAENCNRHPSNQNLTNASNSVVVTLPDEEVPEGYTWKLYRTYDTGSFANSLLQWVVEETSEGSGIITVETTDIGATTTADAPPAASEMISMPEKVDLAEHTTGTLPPSMVPQLIEVSFAFPGTVTPQTGTFTWHCNYSKATVFKVGLSLAKDSVPDTAAIQVDVNRYSTFYDTWTSLFAIGDYPIIMPGDSSGIATPDPNTLFEGDLLNVDIDASGGGAETDEDLLVTISMYVLPSVNEDNSVSTDVPEFWDFLVA